MALLNGSNDDSRARRNGAYPTIGSVESMPSSVVVPLGVIELVLLVLYVVPRTALLGAVLWTGYLGGAIATHVRLENPLFTHVLFPVYIAALLWGALWLRDPRTRVLLSPSRLHRPE